MSQKILNKRSSVLNKAPLPSQVEVGEIAINFNHENPFMSILDSNGEIQKFLSETKTRGLIQDAKEDIDNSFYTKEEINNMFEAFDPSGDISFDNYYTKAETDTLLEGKANSAHTHDYSQILNTPDLSNFATLSDIPSINGLASEVWVGENYQPKGNYLTEHQSLENYYTKSEADNKFLTSHQDLSNYALKSEIPDVSNFVTSAFTDATYAKKGEAPTDVYTKAETDTLLEGKANSAHTHDYETLTNKPDLSIYLTEHQDISNLATKAELENYLTIESASTTYATKSEIPDISDLATKSEIPDTSNFITSAFTESQYQAKGTYVVPSDLDDYALKSELPTVPDVSDFITSAFTEEHYAQVNHTHSQYAEKSEIPDTSNFITSAFTEEHYMKIGSTPTDVYTKAESDSKFQAISAMTEYSQTGHTHDYETLTNKPDLSIYLTEHQDISNLATKAELENYQPQSGMTDYALKSEIPDVSNFVTSAFTEATYAKKGEVPSDAYTKAETDTLLAGKANSAHTHTMSEITDLDVPKTWRGTLAQYNNLTEIDNDTLYIITDSSEQLVTSGDVESMISGYTNLTEVQTLLEGYSTTSHTHSYNDLTDKPTIPSTTGLASEEWVSQNFSTTAHTHDYSEIENTPDLSGFASLSDIPDTSNFITSAFTEEHYMKIGSTPTDVYTKAETDSKFQPQSGMTDYALKSEIPSTTGLASEEWVSQNFSTTAHTHSDLATKAELDDYLTIASASTIYATKEELEEFTPADNYACTVWTGTLAEYNNLTVIDSDTLYVITDANQQYVTSGQVENMTSGYTNLTEVQTLLEGYSQTGHTHSQYLTQTSADSRYARVVSCTQAEYDALVQNDQVEQGVLYCIIEQSNS